MHRRKKILIVEEDPKNIEVIKKTLEQEKYEHLEAFTAEDALELLEKEEVDLVICHTQLVGMSGTDFLAELHNWDIELPVILTSNGGTKEKDWLNALQSEAFDMIQRPIHKDHLLKAVHKALHKKELLTLS